MQIEREVKFLHSELEGERVKFCCYLSNYVHDELNDAMSAWEGEEEVVIENNFNLTVALESLLEDHELPYTDGAMDAEAKPTFDAMRAELVAMVELIDTLIYAEFKPRTQ